MKNNWKILFVIPGFGQGGAQKQCILLINQLIRQFNNIEIHLVYFYEGVYWPTLSSNKVILHKGSAKSMWSLSALVFLASVVISIRPHIVFSWLHSADVFCGILKSLGLIKKWIMAERDSFYPNELRYNVRKLLGKKADLIVSNSGAGAKMWERLGVPQSKSVVHQNILFPSELNFEECDVIYDFLYAGRLEKQKNIDLLLKVISIYPGSRWLIVGNGSYESAITDLASKFPGRLDYLPFQKNIFDCYRRSRVFVSLSLHEGTPNTLIENISIRKRVVVSRIPEHANILGGDYPFFCSPSGPPEDIVKILHSALCDEDVSNDYIFADKRLLEMSPVVVAEKYYAIFDEVINRG